MFRKSIILIIALLAVGLPAVQAQGGGRSTDPALNGTWVIEEGGEELEWTFTNGKFVMSADDEDVTRGTYTTNGRNLTVVITAMKFGTPDWETDGSKFRQWPQFTYYTNGYILTLTFGEKTLTFTRKR
ncbi:MAG: hypothetical protein LBQ69_06610 [Treponema sp.]|jgi:hypothetical protein|nr:hypothetical protein [Treponema sp.]